MSVCQNCNRLQKELNALKTRIAVEVIGRKGRIHAAIEPPNETDDLWVCCGCNMWTDCGYDETCNDCHKQLCYNCTIDGPMNYDHRTGGCKQ